jgi:hypothetical protein
LANGYANAVTTPVGEVALWILAEMIAVRGKAANRSMKRSILGEICCIAKAALRRSSRERL